MPDHRKDRLASDYREMLKIQDRPYLSWIVTKGEPPYAEEYLLNVTLRTYALSALSGVLTVGAIRRCVIRIALWDSYPNAAPHIRMLSMPPVFHPDWYSKGTYCASEPWRPEISLKDHVMRMLRTIAYDPSLITDASPANYKALDWYQKNCGNTAWFPSDTSALSENPPEAIAALEKAVSPFDEIIDSKTGR